MDGSRPSFVYVWFRKSLTEEQFICSGELLLLFSDHPKPLPCLLLDSFVRLRTYLSSLRQKMDVNSAFADDVLLEGERDPDEDDVYRCPPHDMYLMNAPPVSSLSLLEGWDSKALESLQEAVKAVTQANPLLSGLLVDDAEYAPGAVRVEPSRHSIKVHVANVPSSWKPPGPNIRERYSDRLRLSELLCVAKLCVLLCFIFSAISPD